MNFFLHITCLFSSIMKHRYTRTDQWHLRFCHDGQNIFHPKGTLTSITEINHVYKLYASTKALATCPFSIQTIFPYPCWPVPRSIPLINLALILVFDLILLVNNDPILSRHIMFKCKPPLTSANLLQNNRIEMKQALLICFNHPQVISDLMLNLILKTLFLLIFIAYIGLWKFLKGNVPHDLYLNITITYLY